MCFQFYFLFQGQGSQPLALKLQDSQEIVRSTWLFGILLNISLNHVITRSLQLATVRVFFFTCFQVPTFRL